MNGDRAGLRSEGLQRVGAAELIARRLRERILAGELHPGDPLREVEVAVAFGVARNTVREALRLLVQSGLVVHEVHHGVSVRRLNAFDVEQLYGLRAIVESAACDRAGDLSTDEVEALLAPLRDGSRSLTTGDVWAAAEANRAFHRMIVRLLRNPRAEVVHDGLLAELALGLMLEERDAATAVSWHERNRALSEILISGPPALAREAVLKYLTDSREHLLAYV